MVVSDSDDGGAGSAIDWKSAPIHKRSDTQAGVMGHQAHRAEFINAEGSKCRDDFEGSSFGEISFPEGTPAARSPVR